jgi:hypothetical protein
MRVRRYWRSGAFAPRKRAESARASALADVFRIEANSRTTASGD